MAAKNLLSPLQAEKKFEEHPVQMFLGETVLAKANVMRLNIMSGKNSGAIGTLYVTNFKVAFTCSSYNDNRTDYRTLSGTASLDQLLSEDVYNVDDFIPLTSIQHVSGISTTKQKKKPIKNAKKELAPHYDIIEVETKDFRVLQYDFQFASPQDRKSCIQMISHYSFPTATSRLFAFDYGRNVWKSNSDLSTKRVFCNYVHAKDYELNLNRLRSSELWRVSRANENYDLCKSLPKFNICPMSMDDDNLKEIASKYVDNRFPVWLWSEPITGAALLLSSKLRKDTEFTIHEHPVVVRDGISKCQRNLGSGKTVSIEVGSPNPTLKQLKISFNKLKELCIFHSNKEYWDTDSDWLTSIEDTSWLAHVSSCLTLALDVAKTISEKFTSVIVSDSDGRNLSIMITSLVQILLDPFYRTLIGLQALIQKDWVMKGHPFSKRLGHTCQPSSKVKESRTASLRRKPENSEKDTVYDGDSPVFLLFLECLHQLLRQYPLKFEYTEQFLILLIDSSYSSLFSTFLFDSYFESQDQPENTQLVSAWDFIATNIPQSKYVSVFTNASYKIDQMDVELILNNDNVSRSSTSSISQESSIVTSSEFIVNLETRIPQLNLWTGFFFRWFPCTKFNKGSSRETLLQLQRIQFMDELLYLKDRMLQLNLQLISSVPADTLAALHFRATTSSASRRKEKHKRNASRFSNNEEVQNDFLNVMAGFHFLKML